MSGKSIKEQPMLTLEDSIIGKYQFKCKCSHFVEKDLD